MASAASLKALPSNYIGIDVVSLSGSPLYRNGRHLAVIRCQKSALHMETSHFYHDSYYCRFRLVYKLTLLLVTFSLFKTI